MFQRHTQIGVGLGLVGVGLELVWCWFGVGLGLVWGWFVLGQETSDQEF